MTTLPPGIPLRALAALAVPLLVAGIACGHRRGLHLQADPAFHRVGPVWNEEGSPAALLCPDGRVLLMPRTLAPGSPQAGRAELFDPRARAFFRLPSMKVPRQGFALAPLKDGTILVSGGTDGSRTLTMNLLERYHPGEGTFALLASAMGCPRSGHAAVALENGRILLLGGQNGGHPVPTAEVFDPVQDRCRAVGALIQPRMDGFTATRLADGRVLVCGGRTDVSQGVASAELFDPDRGTFRPLPPMGTPRCGHTATLLRDGRVLIVGGTHQEGDEIQEERNAECFDPRIMRFMSTGTLMARARHDAAAALMADGRVIIAGGLDHGTTTWTSDIFDPATKAFSPGPPLFFPRAGHAMTVLADGRLLVVGSDCRVAEILE
jgi:hypothetical protein